MAASILLADDDVELCRLLGELLEQEGFGVHAVHDGEAAVAETCGGRHDVVVLDVMLPKMNGFDVLRRIRTVDATPVIMLTARGEDVDRIVGLEMGADDYLPKPCNPRELVARVRAILRRVGRGAGTLPGESERLVVGDVKLDGARREIHVGGELRHLTDSEYALLETLLRAVGTPVDRATLSEDALGRKLTPFDRSIDMHVSHLRRKLGEHPDGTTRIKTVRGSGYQYTLPRTSS